MNNKIEKEIELLRASDNNELTYMKNYNELKMKDVKSFYNHNQEVKKILEDKAKTNIIGLTISITLIMVFINITELINSFENLNIKIIILILAIMSVGYMIVASLLSINLLVNKNIVFRIQPSDLTLEKNLLKRKYALLTELTIKQNLIRNNYIYSSYECIRNSLILLFTIFIMLLLARSSFYMVHN